MLHVVMCFPNGTITFNSLFVYYVLFWKYGCCHYFSIWCSVTFVDWLRTCSSKNRTESNFEGWSCTHLHPVPPCGCIAHALIGYNGCVFTPGVVSDRTGRSVNCGLEDTERWSNGTWHVSCTVLYFNTEPNYVNFYVIKLMNYTDNISLKNNKKVWEK